jgi:GTP-binding protein HflX
MYDNHVDVNKAILIVINFSRAVDFEEDVAEALLLAESAGFTIVETVRLNRDKPDSGYFVGTGKLEEIRAVCNAVKPQVILINHNILAVQERNLDNYFSGIRIIDRTQLILEIFASRVKSNEGILQVDLAQQSYLATRLVRRWTHLERQRGGIGLRSGSGEKQIELDRRQITDKVAKLKKRLDVVVKQRATQRKQRDKNNFTSVSIVGYTNAGKSTLFNLLTKANVYAENRLFATVQTTSRKLFINDNCSIVLSDTVGFIRDLPTKLIAAFRATLEETVFADLLLHVVDFSGVTKERQLADVNLVLKEIHANHVPQLIIYNKIDLCEEFASKIDYSIDGEPIAVYLSAKLNLGIDLLRQAIEEKIVYLTMRNNSVKELVYEPWKDK